MKVWFYCSTLFLLFSCQQNKSGNSGMVYGSPQAMVTSTINNEEQKGRWTMHRTSQKFRKAIL